MNHLECFASMIACRNSPFNEIVAEALATPLFGADAVPEQWKTIGIRVKESDIPSLNLELKRLGYSSLRELVDAVIAGSFHTQISEISRVLAEEFVNIVKHDLLTFAPFNGLR